MAPVLAELRNPIRAYDWGSREVLARLQGRAVPSPTPEAELWLGAHPRDPSLWLVDGEPRPLDAAVASDPLHLVGPDVVSRFGPRLPFLLKVLAVARPLSLQAHPTADQAEVGFAREEEAGIAPDAPERNYTDPWPKPELVRALTRFHALCGFRPVASTLALLERLAIPGLSWLVASLSDRGEAALHDAIARLLRMPDEQRVAMVAAIGQACAALQDGRWREEARWVAALAEQHPGDPGVAVALLLDLVVLEPGASLHVPPGTLHSYLSGSCVEIMASSDSVLRGGLTSKHIDVDELLRVISFEPDGPRRVATVESGRERVHPVPAPEFRLSELAPGDDEVLLEDRGGQILLVVDGEAEVDADGTRRTLTSGQSAFVAAAATAVRVHGHATVFRATVGDRPDAA